MEPQLEGCGKPPRHTRIPAQVHASMEPQLEGCGKLKALNGTWDETKLQWSRNLRVAERG